MNVKFKSLVAAAAFIATQAALAAPVTVFTNATAYKGVALNGTERWTWDNNLVSLYNLMGAKFTVNAPASLGYATQASNPSRLTLAVLTAPLKSVVIEDTTDDVLTLRTAGGITLTTTNDAITTSGGAVTLNNLEIDLVNKVVYADIQGANGVGTLNHVRLWSFPATGAAKVSLTAGQQTTVAINSLALTTEGYAAISTGLGTNDFSQNALKAVQSFGTLAISVNSIGARPCVVNFNTTLAGTRPTYLSNRVTVTNQSSSPLTGWSVSFQYPQLVLVSGDKNVAFSQQANNVYVGKSVASNSTVAAGASTSFTFSTYYAGTAPVGKVINNQLGGQACAVIQP